MTKTKSLSCERLFYFREKGKEIFKLPVSLFVKEGDRKGKDEGRKRILTVAALPQNDE